MRSGFPSLNSLLPRLQILQRQWRGVLFLGVLGGTGPHLGGQTPSSAPPADHFALVRTVGEYWERANDARLAERPHDLDMQFEVLYYDPMWNLLWFRQNGIGTFFPTKANAALPLRAGQRVRVQGTVVPEKGLDPDLVTITVVDANPAVYNEEPLTELSALEELHISPVKVRGYVDQQNWVDGNHTAVDLIVDNRRVGVRIWTEPNEPMPNLTGGFWTFSGAFVVTPGDEAAAGLALWVPALSLVEPVADVALDPFMAPIVPIAELRASSADQTVRVSGLVFGHEIGKQLVVRDETGQMIIATPQLSELNIGDCVDVVGQPVPNRRPPTLESAVYRLVSRVDSVIPSDGNRESSAGILTEIKLARQVLQLDPAILESNPVAKLVGVVTYIAPDRSFLYVNDATGGLRVRSEVPLSISIKSGMLLEVEGVAGPGEFAPQVTARSINIVGEMDLPVPREVSLEKATSGLEAGQWIRLEGFLRSINTTGTGQSVLSLVTSEGAFEAELQSSHVGIAAGSSIAVTGVCSMARDVRQQYSKVKLLVSDRRQITVLAPALGSPFDLPLTSMGNLRQYRSLPVLNRPIKTKGIVTHYVPGRAVWLTDGSEVLHALLAPTAEKLRPGQRVEIVGIPGQLSGRFVLREARFRAVSDKTMEVEVRPLSTSAIDPRLDGRLVRQTGELVNVAHSDRTSFFFLRIEDNVIEVRLDQVPAPTSRGRRRTPVATGDYQLTSTLEIVGLYRVILDEAGKPVTYQLVARSKDDITVLRGPDWFTVSRALQIAGGALILALLGVSWVLALRRRVATQTKLIELKAADESYQRLRYQEIVDQATEFIFTIDLDGRFTSFNKSGEKMTGISREEAMHKTIYDIVDPQAARRTRIYIARRLNYGKSVTFEYKLIRPDGTHLDVETSAGFIHRGGEIVGGFGIMRDISQRKKDDAERRNFEIRVQQSQKLEAIGTLASGIAHDFNNILAAIMGAVDMSRMDHPDTPQPELFDQIGASARRAKELVRRILAFSRNSTGAQHPIDLRETVREVHSMLRSTVPTSVELRLEVCDQPIRVLANATEVHQVIMNIATNAWHALPGAGGVVTISLDQFQNRTVHPFAEGALRPGIYARLMVEDNGSGMSEAVLSRIFDPFFTTKTDGKGTGLGLAAVHGIVRSHGGSVFVESQLGRGTKFTVLLPITEENVADRQETRSAETPKGSGQRVLVVDDDRAVGMIMERLLRKLNYTPVRFFDSTEAKDYFDNDPDRIDAVLSDLTMPNLSGRDLAMHMLAKRPALPFFIQSGHVEDELEGELRELGVRHVFAKPMSIRPLAQALAEAFHPAE